jgi:uncharacterized OB-fold protein
MSPAPPAPTRPLPRLDDVNAPFWQGARAGELRLQQCTGCGAWRFPAGRHCAQCGGQESRWTPVSGRGTVWSWCVFHQVYFPGLAGAVPYNVVLVKLEEGPLLFSNVVGVPNEALRIGMAVVPHFERVTDEVTLVQFKPAP